MEVSKLSDNKILEIVLLALTYRLSLKSLCEIYKTSEEDIKNAILKLKEENLSRALYFLNIETINEDEETKEYSKNKVMYYIKKKNLLLKKMVGTNDSKRKDDYKILIKELYHQIDDTIVNNTIGKKLSDLTDEEKDALASYRLKYYCSLTLAKKVLHRDKQSIINIEQQKALKDPIFARKLFELNLKFEQEQNNFLINNRIGRRGQR